MSLMPSSLIRAFTCGLIRLELMLKFVERRMGVKLRIAVRQPRQQPQNVILIHMRILQQAEGDLRVRMPRCRSGPRARPKERDE